MGNEDRSPHIHGHLQSNIDTHAKLDSIADVVAYVNAKPHRDPNLHWHFDPYPDCDGYDHTYQHAHEYRDPDHSHPVVNPDTHAV